MPNENVETNQNVANKDKINSQDESENTNDKKDTNLNLDDDKAQSESFSEISSESNEDTSYPGSKEQIIRQRKFYIHSAWLAVQSSYFRSLFFSGMKESNTKKVHVQISTNEEQAHSMLLEVMYKIDTLDKASVDEVLEVLRLAHKYDVKFVFRKCKYVLKDMVDSLETCDQIMHFIKVDNTITDVEDLVSTLQSFLANEFSPLDKTWQITSFKDLCMPSLKYLLSSDKLVTVSENSVFHALMYWIEKRGIENVLESQEHPSLLSVVRFELIPIDYLYNIVQHHPVATKLMDFTDHYLKGISYHALSDTMKQRLPHQPVKRKVETQPFVAFTWVIPTHKLSDAAFSPTDKTLESEEFWYCGYEMRLVISDIVKDRDPHESYAMFMAKLSLEISNLTEESEVSIQWQPISQRFKYTPYEQTHTFDKKTSLSSVDIKYKIKVPPIETNPAEVPLHLPGSFMSSATSASITQSNFTFAQEPAESDISDERCMFGNQTGSTFRTASTISGTTFAPTWKSHLSSRVPAMSSPTFGTALPNSGTAFSDTRTSPLSSGVPARSRQTIGTAFPNSGTAFSDTRTSPLSSGVPARSRQMIGTAFPNSGTAFSDTRTSPLSSGVPARSRQTIGTPVTNSGTTFGGTQTNSLVSEVTAGSSLPFRTQATVASIPKFNFAATNTVKASKSNLVSEQERPNSSSVYIDVKMKLV